MNAYDIFKQEAEKDGVDDAHINAMLDELKHWHNPQALEQMEFDIPAIIEAMKKTIAGFPNDLQKGGARVLFGVWYMNSGILATRYGFQFDEQRRRTDTIFMEAMQEAFAEHLEGETHVVTYDHWLEGGNIDRPFARERTYVLDHLRFDTFHMPPDEYARILEEKKYAAERHIRHFVGILHDRLNRRLNGELSINAKREPERIGAAPDPLALLEDEYDRLTADLQAFGVKHGYLSRLLPGCVNIADTYRSVVTLNEGWIEGTIQPRHINEIDPHLQPAYAVAAQQYKEMIESKLVMYGSAKVKDPFADIPAEVHEIVRRCLEDAFAPFADIVPAGSITRLQCRHAALSKILEVERMSADGLTFTTDLEDAVSHWKQLHEQMGMPHFVPNAGLQPAGEKEEAFTAYCMTKYLQWRTTPANAPHAHKLNVKQWVLYYYYLCTSGEQPLPGRNKEDAYHEIAFRIGAKSTTVRKEYQIIQNQSNRLHSDCLKHIEKIIPLFDKESKAMQRIEDEVKIIKGRSGK